ncbi:hypothetical protein F8388_008088 [Cannabis sativa]|uniref:Uncharacterized protein n=1 Tax=Cannabis sativa TaxID=3483 RepID=A0A7J6EAP8_CANSA|nr:hypothetical protein F8388_008088 [Cannabis sativa]
MELKSRLQEQLFDKMMAQPTIDSIREISPYRNIRETAFDFSKVRQSCVETAIIAFGFFPQPVAPVWEGSSLEISHLWGIKLSHNLHSAPFNNEISKDDFFFLHCFLTHSKDDTWYIIHAFHSKISRCIGTLRTLEISPLWCAPRGMKNRREEESGSLEANKRIRLLWRTKDEIQSIPPFKWFSLLLVPVPNSSPAALSTPPDIWCQIVPLFLISSIIELAIFVASIVQVREDGWMSGMRESGSIDKIEE